MFSVFVILTVWFAIIGALVTAGWIHNPQYDRNHQS